MSNTDSHLALLESLSGLPSVWPQTKAFEIQTFYYLKIVKLILVRQDLFAAI